MELVNGEEPRASTSSVPASRQSASTTRDDGFQTQSIGGRRESLPGSESQVTVKATGFQRRHQIPGLTRTPYLKILFVRCDDNDSYKGTVRQEVREWIKVHTRPSNVKKSSNSKEKHDAFEWLVVHVVIPNTVASTQPRFSGSKSETSTADKGSSSRWRTGSTPLLEKLRSDFNSSGKASVDRVCQIRIGINDVPYELLPRVVPAVPTGYSETEHDAESAWNELMGKIESQILSSFDARVTQYEEDIKERDGQRNLPGWNFCTFFILKEGLARGFENVGLVEDALVGYDELSVGLDAVLKEQAAVGAPESHGGAMLDYTTELKNLAVKAMFDILGHNSDEEAVDLQAKRMTTDPRDEITVSSTKKAYRDMILENKVSVFDFRCYIFSRQIALLLRLGNAMSSREELLAKLKDQEDSVLHGVAPLAPPPPRSNAEPENLQRLAEICQRTLSFIPSISHILRHDVVTALEQTLGQETGSPHYEPAMRETVDNLVSSFAFSVAQQILAQTSSKSLPIPPSSLAPADGLEPKASIPEPKTMMHPARSTSLHTRPQSAQTRPPPSPGVFPGGDRQASMSEGDLQNTQFLKAGLEELAARRAELYLLSRSLLDGLGNKRKWSNGWAEAPVVGQSTFDFIEISLDDEEDSDVGAIPAAIEPHIAGIDSPLLRTAIDSSHDFYRLYEILTDKALRHYTVASYHHGVKASMTDLAVLKYHLKDYRAAATWFNQTTPFFGDRGWTLLELSMLVMYTRCLGETGSKDEYLDVGLTLLTKSCAAEKERLMSPVSPSLTRREETAFPDTTPIRGVVGKLFGSSSSLPKGAKVALQNFFTNVELMGAPEYHENKDSCSLRLTVHSLLPEEITVDSTALRLSFTDGGLSKQVWFRAAEEIEVRPGKNVISLNSNVSDQTLLVEIFLTDLIM